MTHPHGFVWFPVNPGHVELRLIELAWKFGELVAIHANVNALWIKLEDLENGVVSIVGWSGVQAALDKPLLAEGIADEAEAGENERWQFHW